MVQALVSSEILDNELFRELHSSTTQLTCCLEHYGIKLQTGMKTN